MVDNSGVDILSLLLVVGIGGILLGGVAAGLLYLARFLSRKKIGKGRE